MAHKTKPQDPLKQFGNIEKIIQDRLKQVQPMMKKAESLLANLPNYAPIQIKTVEPQGSDGPKVKMSLTAGKTIILEFPSQQEALDHYNVSK
jgi:hypothetical protein